jgi:ATP-dependent helicase HrpA
VVVIAGETGSGKTTQLPKICLELGRGRESAHRAHAAARLAARTVAQRIAEELGSRWAGWSATRCGSRTRSGDDTAVKLMTDGILLSELQRDRDLRQYDTLIIDEAHERSLNIDFLLGYLKRLLPRRPDLKLLITSATIDVERFADYFGGAPVIRGVRAQLSGRDTLPAAKTEGDGEDPLQQVADTVRAVQAGEFGAARGHAGVPARRAGYPRCGPARCAAATGWMCCRCTPGSARPSRPGSSAAVRPRGCAWCWPPTLRRRPLPCPASAS